MKKLLNPRMAICNATKNFREICMKKEDLVYKTCLVIIQHFKNLIEYGSKGFHSRIFEYLLHPQYEYVGAGKSKEVKEGSDPYPEHVVPCAVLRDETKRLIKENRNDEYIAKMLQKHWKVAMITQEQANYLDKKLGYKSTMPDGWNFEIGDTFARLKAANIILIPDIPED